MSWAKLILEILSNLSKVVPKWCEWWAKRKDLAYIEKRNEIRREKKKLWQKIQAAKGDEKAKLIQKYLDRFIRNR